MKEAGGEGREGGRKGGKRGGCTWVHKHIFKVLNCQYLQFIPLL